MFKSQDNNANSFNVKTDATRFQLEQNMAPYLEYAAEQRYRDSLVPSNRQHRSFAIIPDIVAIDIKLKFGIDIHAPTFGSDPAEVTRLKNIVRQNYPKLLTSNSKG